MLASLLNSRRSYTLLLLGVMLVLSVFMSLISPYFLTPLNIKNLFNQSSVYLLLTIGMTFVIASGEIDLSGGAIIGFSGMIMSNLYYWGVPGVPCVIVGLASSALVGVINGFFVAHFKINSFIVTLCSMSIMRGIILVVMNSRTRFGFGDVFAFLGAGDLGPINMPILIALLVSLVAYFVMAHTKFGNYSLFLGTNEVALSRAGVNTRRQKIAIFAVSGLLAGVAGVVVMGRLNSAEPLAGQGYEMDAIAAVILGGMVLEGGKGNVTGPFVACLILNIIKNGLVLVRVSTHYQEIVTGAIIIIAVIISSREHRRRSET